MDATSRPKRHCPVVGNAELAVGDAELAAGDAALAVLPADYRSAQIPALLGAPFEGVIAPRGGRAAPEAER
jgi:hypothetical protein